MENTKERVIIKMSEKDSGSIVTIDGTMAEVLAAIDEIVFVISKEGDIPLGILDQAFKNGVKRAENQNLDILEKALEDFISKLTGK